jgi:arsenate reductase-like glutaredoxin family protein
LLELGAQLESRDLDKQRLTEAELDELIGERDYKEFLNTRNELYRLRNMKDHPPSRAEALKLLAKEPNLIRRPIVIRRLQMVLGFDDEAYRKLVK